VPIESPTGTQIADAGASTTTPAIDHDRRRARISRFPALNTGLAMPRRIALISQHASPLAASGGIDACGQNVCVAHTASELAALGNHVDVFTRRDDPELPAVVAWAPGIRVIHIEAGPPRCVRSEDLLPTASAFAERVLDIATSARDRAEGYSLAHAHFFLSGLVARKLKDELDIPYAVTFHELGRVRLLHQGRDDFPRERGVLEQMVIDDADAVIALSPQDAADMQRHYDVDASRIAIVPCGFAPREFEPIGRDEARRRLGMPLDRPIVLQLGRLVPSKGVDNVIRAVAIAHREHDVQPLLVVVGGDSSTADPELTPEIGRLSRIAHEEGVSEHVKFIGRRGRCDLRDFYCAADVFVATPWYETCGIAPLEAMACGLPVIGSRVGGLQHTIEVERTGMLVEPKDSGALARAIAAMLSDPATARAYGRRGRRRAHRSFTWQRVARELDALYARIAGADSTAQAASSRVAARQTG
jgi:glycosyltransferase involved in cell wall biosynthesis